MSRVRICVWFLSIFLGVGALYILAGRPAYYREETTSLVREIFNFHMVAPKIMRGSQPDERGFKLLKYRCGVKTILSLHNDAEHNHKAEAYVNKLGMKFINIPMEASKEQSVETIEKCLKIISDSTNHPIFVYCQAGKDRTGLIFAAYRIKYNQWQPSDALREMLLYGYDYVHYPNLEKALLMWNNWRKDYSQEGRKEIIYERDFIKVGD